MGYYAILKTVFRRLAPEDLRKATYDPSCKLYPVLGPLKHLLQRYAKHNDVYDRVYYEEVVEPLARRSTPVMARSIRDVFHPSRVVDVGCGTGQLLADLAAIGVDGVGYEYSEVGLAMARGKGVEVHPLNLEMPLDRLPKSRGDLVVSTEVAEHLPESWADTYVDYLCATADDVLITAAVPGQGGTDHVNEQPNSYWIGKFAARGFSYEDELTRTMRNGWLAAGIADFYALNVLIFRKPAAAS